MSEKLARRSQERSRGRDMTQRSLLISGIETVPLTEDQEKQAISALATLLASWWEKRSRPGEE
jgi:hypothetical protein